MPPTRTQLVIEGNLVTKVEIEEGKEWSGGTYRREVDRGTVELSALLESLVAARDSEWFVPRLENGQIIARKSVGSTEAVAVEFSPAIRRILERLDQSDSRARQLAFPWVYLVGSFSGGALSYVKVFFRNERAEGSEAELYWPNLPNVYGDGRLCTGTARGCDPTSSIARRCDWLARMFWDSQFNSDLADYHWRPSRNLANHPQSFANWEVKSATDPRFILEVPWRSVGLTLRQVLDAGVK